MAKSHSCGGRATAGMTGIPKGKGRSAVVCRLLLSRPHIRRRFPPSASEASGWHRRSGFPAGTDMRPTTRSTGFANPGGRLDGTHFGHSTAHASAGPDMGGTRACALALYGLALRREWGFLAVLCKCRSGQPLNSHVLRRNITGTNVNTSRNMGLLFFVHQQWPPGAACKCRCSSAGARQQPISRGQEARFLVVNGRGSVFLARRGDSQRTKRQWRPDAGADHFRLAVRP